MPYYLRSSPFARRLLLQQDFLTATRPGSISFRFLTPVFTKDTHRLLTSSVSLSKMASPVFTKDAPKPFGPYSQAIKTPGLIFVSGQLAAEPDGTMIEGSMGQKTAKIAQNIKAIVEEAGSSMEKIVKVNIFLDDMAHFPEVNAEFEKWFTSKPARSTVAVKTLPANQPIEIECIALA